MARTRIDIMLRLKRYVRTHRDYRKHCLQMLPSKKERFECPLCGYSGPLMHLNPLTGLAKHATCPKCNAPTIFRHLVSPLGSNLGERNDNYNE